MLRGLFRGLCLIDFTSIRLPEASQVHRLDPVHQKVKDSQQGLFTAQNNTEDTTDEIIHHPDQNTVRSDTGILMCH